LSFYLQLQIQEQPSKNAPRAPSVATVSDHSRLEQIAAVAVAEVRLEGTPEKYAHWDSLDLNVKINCSKASRLDFEYVDLGNEPDKLLDAIKGCHELRSVRIVIAKWTGNFTTKILLPKLEDFGLVTGAVVGSAGDPDPPFYSTLHY
jgi:hypothetical protein